MNNVCMTPFQIILRQNYLPSYSLVNTTYQYYDQINYAVSRKFHTMIGTNFGEPTLPVFLYPRHLCRVVYSFRLSVRPYICSFVRFSLVRSFVIPSLSWNYFKVLRYSFSSVVYLSNHSSESNHIWTLEGRLSFHDS